jgi:hypothetical protein
MLNFVKLNFLKYYISQLPTNKTESYAVLTKNSKIKNKRRVSKSILSKYSIYLNVPGIKYILFEDKLAGVLEKDPIKVLYKGVLFDKKRLESSLLAKTEIISCFAPIFHIINLLNARERSRSN